MIPIAAVVLLTLAGCQREQAAPTADQSAPAAVAPDGSSGGNAAVEAAVRSYLASRPGLNLEAMNVEFKEIKIADGAAEADVLFRSKSGEGEMTMHYQLLRQGGQWVVQRDRAPSGSGPLPPGHPPTTPRDPSASH